MPWGALMLALVLLVYTAILLTRFAPAISEPDDNGYFAQGSLLVTTGHTWFKPQSDAQFIGIHWLLTPSGNYVSRYPPGLAVIVGLAYALGGFKLAAMVNPALSMLALSGMYLLARRFGLSRALALCAVILLAGNPTFLHHALSGDSHMGVTCALVWGLYLLLRWSEQGLIWQAFAAGVVLGCIPTIRYPDAIMAIAIIVFMLSHWRSVPRIGWHIFAACAGVAIPLVPLLIRNQLVLGAFWRTGYSLTNEQTGFSWAFFREHALQYIQQLQSGGLGLMFALGIVGMTYMICSKRRREGVGFALIALPMLLLYMAYYWAPQMSGATMRFLLPTFPVYTLAGVWVIAQLLRQAPTSARFAVPIVVIIVQMLWGIPEGMSQTLRQREAKTSLAAVTNALESNTNHGDVVIANPQILQNLDFVRHWKLADPSVARGGMMGGRNVLGPRRDLDPDSPSPMQQEKRELMQTKYTGSSYDREQKFAEDILNFAGDKKIYLVGTESEVKRMLGSASHRDDIRIVGRFTLPKTPEPRRIDSPQGMGGPPGMGRPGFGVAPGRQAGPMGPPFPSDAKEFVIAEWNPA